MKLVLHKIRVVLLLTYTKEMEEGFKEQFVKEDFDFLKKLSQDKENKHSYINSEVLYELLGAYDSISRSYISQLPVELALVKLLKEQQ